ncbi:hypothetical protein [Leucobacter sp. wl10]|uniref:hypothetical protein n=1 Tax=Leucobacter sp. wl10 TaxID=2304677 RepID=UPI0013C2B2B0|nr:hypothetical protein [Leucobacter sp. wl10]
MAETDEFQIWTARDNSDNICVISLANATGNVAGYCGSEEQTVKAGVPGSMQVGIADEGDTSVTVLQTYLLPDGADAAAAAKQIPGSQAFGQLVVRYGPMELERTTTISVPAENGEVSLTVFGRDSLS